MILGFHSHGIAQDRCPAMRCRAQADNMRSKIYKSIIGICGLMVERDMYSQDFTVMYVKGYVSFEVTQLYP